MAKILIIEDQSDIRDMMRMWLEMDEHEIHEAEDGREGIDKTLALLPDLVLMDMHMPVLDGHEAVRILRQEHGYTGVIIAVTASVMESDLARYKNLGCNDYIPKPIGMDFCDRINELLTKTFDAPG